MNKPIKYYYPTRLWHLAEIHAEGWGRYKKNRTIKTENGECPCIDVMDANQETIYLLIIDDDLYLCADRSERMTSEVRGLILHDKGEYIVYGRNNLHLRKVAKEWCKENGRELISVHHIG